MDSHVTVTLKKGRQTSTKLGFGRMDRISFFFGIPIKYKSYEIEGNLGTRTIYVDYEKHGMPEVPAEVVEYVRYTCYLLTPKYPNGVGKFGEVHVDCRTLDGEQTLYVSGSDPQTVKRAISNFQAGTTPQNWDASVPRITVWPRRIIVENSRCDDNGDLFFSR